MPKSDVEISATIANALVTGAQLSELQLEAAYLHYKTLADMLSHSGPKFSEAKISAVDLGNAALDRLRKLRRAVREAELARETDDGLEAIR